MLTADLVNARRHKGELKLTGLTGEDRARAEQIAAALLDAARRCVNGTREDFDAAMRGVDVASREVRLRDGLAKLIEDACTFAADESIDAEPLRRELFAHASAARSALIDGAHFDRVAVMDHVARARGIDGAVIEAALFSDLRAAHVLSAVDAPPAPALVADYLRSQAQAVLLRAVKVTVDVRAASALALRALFRKLKFLRVLHHISHTAEGQRIVIDGPFSMFESVTKYGLQLALVLPALESCDAWTLTADLRWGKTREPLTFRLTHEAPTRTGEHGEPAPPTLPKDVEELVESFTALKTKWRISPNQDILELPGVGLTVPDLLFERDTGKGKKKRTERVFLEVMGYWSRDAVWKRVELVRAGFEYRVLFAVSSRLRVSEAVLDADLPSALYVYKGVMSAREIARRLDILASILPPLRSGLAP